MSIVLTVLIVLGATGALAALILYFVSQRFKVEEDPRIDLVEEALPAANCGGCGFPGCRAFAEALVKTDDISDMNCPVGGTETMTAISGILGKEVKASEPMVAVLRCNGSCEQRPRTNRYNGAGSCAVASLLYGGETGCTYGCHGYGDCVKACNFDAMDMDLDTRLPIVYEDKCVACGACVDACPKDLFELRKKGPKGRRVYVSCMNEDKGALARKNCSVACIGCTKCVKECQFDAITMVNNRAYIDYNKCRLCRKCAPVCPTNAILETNFPPRRTPAGEKTEKQPVKTE